MRAPRSTRRVYFRVTRLPAPEIRVGPITLREVDGRSHAECTVDGFPVFYDSADAPIAPVVEAFASPFLLSALETRSRLRLEEPPSATWLANARKAADLFRRWWGFDGPDPLEGIESRADAGPPKAVAGQLFSAGIDSFYTLFHSPHPKDVLVTIHGFDVRLGDEERMANLARSSREVAAGTGRRAIVVRTSLRRHPRIRASRWNRVHGGILGGVAHALSESIGSLLIATSWGSEWKEGWGSHWDLDPLWSGDRVRVIHDDPTLQRWDKVPPLANEPLFFQHFHVCWEQRSPAANCGVCEKCVRTRVVFLRWGLLDKAEGRFATKRGLVESIDRISPVSILLAEDIWLRYSTWPLPPEVRAAGLRLVDRSRRAAEEGLGRRILRRIGKGARRLARHGRRPAW